jgi:hypothetical protein
VLEEEGQETLKEIRDWGFEIGGKRRAGEEEIFNRRWTQMDADDEEGWEMDPIGDLIFQI